MVKSQDGRDSARVHFHGSGDVDGSAGPFGHSHRSAGTGSMVLRTPGQKVHDSCFVAHGMAWHQGQQPRTL